MTFLAENAVGSRSAIGAVIAVAGFDQVVATAAPDLVVAVERDELVVLAGAGLVVRAVGPDEPADPGFRDQGANFVQA